MTEPLSASAAILRIVERARAAGARFVHLESDGDIARFRFRHGGVLAPWSGAPRVEYAQLVARLKGAVGLGTRAISQLERRTFQVDVAGTMVDVDLLIQPGMDGEQVVIGLPGRQGDGKERLTDLGIEDGALTGWRQALRQRRGLILVGASTRGLAQRVASAAVREIDTKGRRVSALLAVRGPAPAGVHRVPVDSGEEWTPAAALRAQFAMDVDVIVIGFTPDEALAAAMVEGALVHDKLIIATMPSRDAVGAIRGMLALGVEPWPLAEALILVHGAAQVRALCSMCKAPQSDTKQALAPYGLSRSQVSKATLFRAHGCGKCGGSGYRGHRILGETAVISAATADAIVEGAGRRALAATLVVGGAHPLRTGGVTVACAGITSLVEVLAETPPS